MVIFPNDYPRLPPIGFYLPDDLPISARRSLLQVCGAWRIQCTDPGRLEMVLRLHP